MKKLFNKTAVLTLSAIVTAAGVGSVYYMQKEPAIAKQDNGFYSTKGI